jgi:hypothetical protein
VVSETIELHKFVFLQNACGCVHEVVYRMDINAEIAVQPGGIRLTDIAGIGVRILFTGAT